MNKKFKFIRGLYLDILILKTRTSCNSIYLWDKIKRCVHVDIYVFVILLKNHLQLFCNPVDCSLLDSSVYGNPRWEYWSGLPLPSPGDLPDPGVKTHVSYIGRQILYHWATREVPVTDGEKNPCVFILLSF